MPSSATSVPGEARTTTGHAFISYVREDSAHVDRLQQMLEDAGIPVWRDTADLWPGKDWRAQIRGAITRDALTFLVCFSQASVARVQSYQNEELVVAIEQLRLRPHDVAWLIPIRFDDCPIPDRDIGGGRTLRSLHYADLFGDRYHRNAQRLVRVIQDTLGGRAETDAPPEPATRNDAAPEFAIIEPGAPRAALDPPAQPVIPRFALSRSRAAQRVSTGLGDMGSRVWLTAAALLLVSAAVLVSVTGDQHGTLPFRLRVPAAIRLPRFGIRLPGTHTNLLLKPNDPIRLLSYLPYGGRGSYALNPASGRYGQSARRPIISPDGWHEAIIGKQNVTIVNLRTDQRRSTQGFPGHAPAYDQQSLDPAANPQFSPDSRYLLTISRDGYIAVINTSNLRIVSQFRLASNAIQDAWWTSDSAHIIVQVSAYSAAVFDLSGHLRRKVRLGANAYLIDSAFGRLLYQCPDTDLRFTCIRDVSTGEFIARVPTPSWSGPSDIGVLGLYDKDHIYGWSGNRLVVRDLGGHIVRILAIAREQDAAKPPWLFFSDVPPATTRTGPASSPAYGVTLPGSGTTLFLKRRDPLTLFSYRTFSGGNYLLDPQTGRYQSFSAIPEPNNDGLLPAISPDGRVEATVGRKTVTFTERNTGYERTISHLKYPPPRDDFGTVAQFSPDGRYLLTMTAGHQNTYAEIIKVKTFQHWALKLPANSYNGDSWWTPDSAHIVVPVRESQVAVYDLRGHLQRRLRLGYYAYSVDSAFSLLLYFCPVTVETSWMTAVCIRNIWTGKLLARLTLPASPKPGAQLLGIFDREHFFSWDGNLLVVRDFRGNLTRVLAIDHQNNHGSPSAFFNFTHDQLARRK